MTVLPRVQYQQYYGHQALTAHLKAVAAVAPQWVKLHNLYTTPAGREEWLVEVTDPATGPGERKPAYLVHANLHAPEVSGTTAALRLLERLLTEPDLRCLLREVVFYLVPRLNPDGAEYALVTGGPLRSAAELRPCRNGLVPQDLNGDGLVLNMRWPDPYGPWVCDEEDPRLMRPRQTDDEGPFYEMTSEGLIEDYDGGPLQSAVRGFDFNRNWGYNWQPEPVQWGAGNYAFSQPEMKALADWVFAHPNVFGMLGFHNGCNAVLRPSATTPDEEINAADLKLLRELAEEGSDLTGFPALAVRMYKTDGAPPISLKGHFTDWGYFGLGLLVFEIELGNSFNAAGLTTAEYFAADETTREGDFRRRLLRLFDEHPEWGGWVDWQRCAHPQLGEVEVGGMPATVYACPPPAMLEEIGTRCADFIASHASRYPRLEISGLEVDHLGGGVYRLRATVANTGLLSTSITQRALELAHQPVVEVRLSPGEGAELVSRGALREIACLTAATGHEDLEWFVRTAQPGMQVTLSAQHPRARGAEVTVSLD